VRASAALIAIGLSLAAALASLTSCRTPPPPRIQVPSETDGNPYTTYKHDEVKPLPPSATQSLDDASAVGPSSAAPRASDPVVAPPPGPPPVSQSYIEAYDRVGRPRLLVLVERPSSASPRAIVPGDYELVERVVGETLAARGQVMVVPSSIVAEKIDAQQFADIHAGRADALADAGGKLRADVLVQVKLVPPGTGGASDTQLTATARNTRDSQQIATASAALGNPPQRRQLDFAARLLSERLADELAGAWNRLAEKQSAGAAAPAAPATQPTTQK
jgi:hypothetical protein